jgi:peptidoglycan/xylan/chitin deacetylase (PgdA/CDA1 family)
MKSSGGSLRSLRALGAPLAKTCLLRAGGFALLRGLAPSRRIAILRYHAICDEEGFAYASPSICISPGAFEAQVGYLAANYSVLPLPEIVDRLRHDRPLPLNTVAITFDDGYADNLSAARVLQRHGVSATFYITAGCLHGDAPFWPSEVRYLVSALAGPALTLRLPHETVTFPVATEPERQKAIRGVTRLLKSNRIPVREDLRRQLRAAAGQPAVPRHMLTWDELAEMRDLGMTIGAHTYTHANLPSAGLADATVEITQSRSRLEETLGPPVTMFSYPNGGAERYYDAPLQRVVADAGFAAATSSRNAFATRSSDLYALERIEVEERLEDLVFALEVERFAFRPASEASAQVP